MLNVIWGFFLIGGILTGAFLGRMDLVTNAVIDGGRNAVELAFTMAGVVAVWSGILKIAEKGGMIDALAEKMEPFLDFLFPEVPRGHAARRYISANFAANFLGLGWAATPAGLLAMEELAKLNGKTGRASNAMCMFLVVNMSSLQLVTVNILAYRAEYGSAAPAEIMGGRHCRNPWHHSCGYPAGEDTGREGKTLRFLMVLSDFIIPVTVLFIVVFGSLKRVNLYETFLEGAKEGLHTVVNILPTLLGLMVAVEVLRAGGLLELLTKLLAPLEYLVGFPAELAPLTLVRLVSSSAAVGLLTEIFAAYGPDSFLGRSASVMMYCTETVFYTMSLYFLSVGITKTRHTLFCALAANFTGVALSLFLVGQLFGAG